MYQTPEVLSKDSHGALQYSAQKSFQYAANQTTAPLLDEEIALVSASYVIVFPMQGSARPLALLGLQQTNRYLDAAGQWTAPYIPAFIRRYPFVFGQGSNPDGKLHLAIDAQAPHFAGVGEPLFTAEGEPAPVALNAVDFLAAYQKSAQRTEVSHLPLFEAGVIVPKNLTQELDGKTHVIGGFGVVDQEKLNALPDATLATWARNGLLATVYAHWASLRHLTALVAAEARPATTN